MTDKSVVEQIKHYQRDILKCPDNTKRMIRCIERLMVLPVTIAHLQETGVGRSVNELRKCGGEVGAAANALVCKWKSMVQAEEDSDGESEVEDDPPKETVQVSSPDIRNSPSIKNDRHKKTQDSEEYKKQKSDHSIKKREPSHPENKVKSSEKNHLDKHDYKSHQNKPSKSEHSSRSDSKYSSSHRSKSDCVSRPNHKSHSSHRSDSECNGDTKTERHSSKSKYDENKLSKSSSSESKSKDVKQNNYKDKRRKEDSASRSEKENRRREGSSHSSISTSSAKKYDVRKMESESSDDDDVYKPKAKKQKKSESEEDWQSETRSRKKSESEEDRKLKIRSHKKSESEEDRKSYIRSQKKSESEEDVKQKNDKYSGRNKHNSFIKHEDSEESDTEHDSEEDENSRPSSVHSYIQKNMSDNDEEISNRSSPNLSEHEADSDSRRSSSKDDENEDSHSDNASDSNGKDSSPEREIYVPTKIKREKDSPPRHFKSSSEKSQSSHSKSSRTSSHKSSDHNSSSHHSDSRSTNGKISSNKKEFKNDKIKKEKEESDDFKRRKEEKSSDKKVHKSSNSHSDSSIQKSSSNKAEKKVKIKIEKEVDGSIDSVSGASFADALMGLSAPSKKLMKRKSIPSSPEKPRQSAEKSIDGKSKSLHKSESRISSSSSSSSCSKTGFKEPELLSKSVKLEPLDVDLKSTLPEISPHYKPLPHYSPPDSPAGKRSKLLSQEEALSSIMSTKNQRTKVYSGNKTGYLKVPSLFDLCIQVLRDNIEALEYTGGVPYDLLKPVLDRATASQLFQLEHYNPYLVEDTDNLWKFHCNKDFRGKEPDEFETWRELYVRLLDERERKLEALKANITQSMAKNTPVRQTKLAYVDSVVKPPRNIAKKQMKFGTGKAVKHDLVSKAMVGAAGSAPAPAAVPVPAPPASARSSQSNAFPIPGFLKKKKAPLMQKTLQLIKGNRFKR